MKYSFLARYPLIILFTLACLVSYAQVADSTSKIPDTLLFKIKQAQATVTEVNASNKQGYNFEVIASAVAKINTDVAALKQGLKARDIDTKALQSYELILKDAGNRLEKVKNALMKSNDNLQQMMEKVLTLSNDTVLVDDQTGNADKVLYSNQLKVIKLRLQNTGEVTGANLERSGKLLAEVSAIDILINDLKTAVADRLQQQGKIALGREVPVLWESTLWANEKLSIWEQVKNSYLGQKQIIQYFFSSTWDKRILLWVIALVFFVWVHRNAKLASRPAVKRKIGELKFSDLHPFPFLATLIVALNLLPLLESDAPSIYIEIIQLVLLLAITKHLTALSAKQWRVWLQFIVAYLFLISIATVSNQGIAMRLLLIGLHLFFIFMALRFFAKLRLQQFPKKYVKAVLAIGIFLNVLAIVLNIFGRLSLSKVLALAGVVGCIQLLALAIFIQIILDALELQLRISACSKGIFSRINHGKTRQSVKKILWWLAIVIWSVVFLNHLNLMDVLFNSLKTALSKPRSFGAVHFSFGNILFFILIIYIANKIQKGVPIVFGEGTLSYEGQVEQKSSKVALIRLIIIIVALLLALTASGLPMDRVTVILGALGVGIGLGMQNIVNNFVSGVILIFERPFRIGDFVELADKKGRVKDIGIRSSKLLTQQGSEVIIPNGDLLSGRLVNWTLSHDYVKTELLFKVPVETDLDQLKKLIDVQLAKTQHRMEHLPPEMLVNTIAAGAIEIKLLTWVENIYAEPLFKSELMIGLIKRLNEAEIKIL